MHLDVSKNHLHGEIPFGLSRSKLNTLRFHFNYFSGTLPGDMFTSTTLAEVKLQKNMLSGTIPEGDGSNLFLINLSDNMISGAINDRISKFTKLQYLLLNLNQLQGSIPNNVDRLKNLTHCKLIYLSFYYVTLNLLILFLLIFSLCTWQLLYWDYSSTTFYAKLHQNDKFEKQ